MSIGQVFVAATAAWAFVLWFFSVREMVLHGVASAPPRARWLWLLGAGMMCVHIVLSFEVYHDWSHSAAVLATAQQTKDVVGIEWGGGVWVNYVFVAVWWTDVIWWFARPGSYVRRPQTTAILLHGFLAFIWFYATVVFGSTNARIYGVMAFGYLGGSVVLTRPRRKS